jgi:glycine/D-amino acid oxidase-like deaminating enzyme
LWGAAVEYDIIVLGAGSAGIALADAASRLGLKCVVFECNPAYGYASVRNQGWLHSGALYAAGNRSGTLSTIEKCRAGKLAFETLAQELDIEIFANPAVMIFRDVAQYRLAFEEIQRAYLWVQQISPRELRERVPILGSELDLAGGLLTSDSVINAPAALNALMRRACSNGSTFCRVDSHKFSNFRIEPRGSEWRVDVPQRGIAVTKHLILACGVLIPSIVKNITANTIRARLVRGEVMTLDCRPCNEILMFLDPGTYRMNIAPYSEGITINLGAKDDDTDDIDNLSPYEENKQLILDTLAEWAPGLAAILPAKARLYVCQKFEMDLREGRLFERTRGRRDAIYREIQPGLHIFYPGKFTQALTASLEVLDEIFSPEPIHCAGSVAMLNMWQYTHPGTRLAPSIVEWNGRDFLWR